MADLSGLSNVTTAASALSNLILVTPNVNSGYQPQNPPNADGSISTAPAPPTILFNYEGENSVTLESDITDHYVEDNTAINDQIALRPETITAHGYIGELNDVTPKILQALRTAADKLQPLVGYAPVISQTALLAYNEAAFLYSVGQNAINSAVSAWSSINGKASTQNQTKQALAFQQFYGYWKSRTLFTVQTPWGKFGNCAIKTLRAVQDESTRMITDFEVTFKILRFASTITIASTTVGQQQGRAAAQGSSLTDLGTSTPPPAPISFGSAVSGAP